MLEEFLNLKTSWAFLKETNLPIVLYGTGNGADKILDRFEALSISLYGVCASDGFVRSRSFRGHEVKPISYFKETLSDFVIVIGFGSERPELSAVLHELSQKYPVIFPCVPVYGTEIFDKAFFRAHIEELERVYTLLADEKSKEVFKLFLRFQLCGHLEDLEKASSDKDEIFETVLRLHAKESYLDLGAYRGDTIAEFLHYTNEQYTSIVALEPNAKTFQKLKEYVTQKNLLNTKLFNAAVAEKNGVLHFSGDGRHNVADERGSMEVPCKAVDSLSVPAPFTYLKADVEGLEYDMLLGAKKTLQRDKPKLNLALYHKSEDVYKLPLFLHGLVPSYQFYVRKHPGFPFWDFNLYCI